jgi:hypothetical protein
MAPILGFRHVSLRVSKRYLETQRIDENFDVFSSIAHTCIQSFKADGQQGWSEEGRMEGREGRWHYQKHDDVKTTSSEKGNTAHQNKQRLLPPNQY